MGRPRSTPDPARAGTRLPRLIAEAGLASRREAEEWIAAGRVRVNGRCVREPGLRVEPGRDRVEVDGRALPRPPARRHYLLYKPRGVVSTTRDPHAKRTVLSLLPAGERLFPVGRLDAASEGLLLVTNDGALAHALLHPSFEVPRRYRVRVEGPVAGADLERLRGGLPLGAARTSPCEARILRREPERTELELVLREGQNRQIRRMLEALGYRVRRLVRTQFGPLLLRGLRPGEWRPLVAEERRALARLVAAASAPGRNRQSRRNPSAKGSTEKE